MLMVEAVMGYVLVMIEIIVEGEMLVSPSVFLMVRAPRCRLFDSAGRLPYGSPRKEKRIWSWRGGGEAFLGGAVAGGAEGGEEGFVGMDFVGEAFACGFLAVVREIGRCKILL